MPNSSSLQILEVDVLRREDDTFQSGLPLYRVATNAPEIHTKVPTIWA